MWEGWNKNKVICAKKGKPRRETDMWLTDKQGVGFRDSVKEISWKERRYVGGWVLQTGKRWRASAARRLNGDEVVKIWRLYVIRGGRSCKWKIGRCINSNSNWGISIAPVTRRPRTRHRTDQLSSFPGVRMQIETRQINAINYFWANKESRDHEDLE